MREIVLDTETTGLDPADGHRLVEIAGVELLRGAPTGKTFHVYINPQRDMPEEAFRIHGLSAKFLSEQPIFSEIVEEFLSFIEQSPLVIHNAEFDLKFLNAELTTVGKAPLPRERAIDSLLLARKKFPGASNSLDALCSRFKIDASRRSKHGALIDAELLAEVYCELNGGRQSTFELVNEEKTKTRLKPDFKPQLGPRTIPLRIQSGELDAHADLIDSIGQSALWRQFITG